MHVEETDPRGAKVLGSDVWALPLTEDRILKGFLFSVLLSLHILYSTAYPSLYLHFVNSLNSSFPT